MLIVYLSVPTSSIMTIVSI